MKLTLTGGVGFIGYHLGRALLDRGDELVILDDFSDAPYPRAFKERNRDDLLRDFGANCTILEGCVTDPARAGEAVTGADAVLHLAGLAGVRPSFDAPAHYARVNVEGTACMLEAARAAKVPRFVFASSSSVYGDATPAARERVGASRRARVPVRGVEAGRRADRARDREQPARGGGHRAAFFYGLRAAATAGDGHHQVRPGAARGRATDALR